MKNILHYALVFLIALSAPHVTGAFPRLLASFTASPQAWTAAFETNPANTDSVSQADDHMRQIKLELRDRIEAEHDFAELGNVTTDTGRHLEGSARVFRQNAAPTIDGFITAACLGEADYDGNRGCDDGRLFVDADGPDNTGSTSDDNTLYVSQDTDSDGDADSWGAVVATSVPANAIILWDTSNTCPLGYTEVTAFRGLMPRGADRAAADTGIPDNAGATCSGSTADSGCNAAGGFDNYDDDLSTDEMPSHNHDIGASTGTGGGTTVDIAGGSQNQSSTTGSEGGSENHYHPFRTVLFCRKS